MNKLTFSEAAEGDEAIQVCRNAVGTRRNEDGFRACGRGTVESNEVIISGGEAAVGEPRLESWTGGVSSVLLPRTFRSGASTMTRAFRWRLTGGTNPEKVQAVQESLGGGIGARKRWPFASQQKQKRSGAAFCAGAQTPLIH